MIEKPKDEHDSMESITRKQPEILHAQIEFLKKWCQCAVERLIADRIPMESSSEDNARTQLPQA